MASDKAAETAVLDTMFGISWDLAKCGYRGCLRLADLRCPKCPGEFYCQDHKRKHLKSRHAKKNVDDYGAKVCEVCTDFKVEFFCTTCKLYQCFKCAHTHIHPVFPVAGARGLCNAKLSWGNAFLEDVSKYMHKYKREMAPAPPTQRPAPPAQQPARSAPSEPSPPPAAAPTKPHDPRKPPPSIPTKPRDPRQPPVKQEVTTPAAVAAPATLAAAPPVVVAPPPPAAPPVAVAAPVAAPVAEQRPVKQEPGPKAPSADVLHLPTSRDDKTFITSSSLPHLPPLPHVGGNYLKGIMLDNYNKFNDQAEQLDKAIRKLEVEARVNVSSQSLQVALTAVNRRSELQRALEEVFRQRDEAVAQVIVYDPPVLAQYDAAQDPANPAYKAPVINPMFAQRYVPLKHGMCAKMELKIQALLNQWVHVQDQMVAVLSQHDVAAMERLQEEIEALESQMCAQDALRAAQFIEISVFSERVRQLVAQYRQNVPAQT